MGVLNVSPPDVAQRKSPTREPLSVAPPSGVTGNVLSEAADSPGRLWECGVCGFVYAEQRGLPDEGIPPGTAWADIPDAWKCPDCGTSKAQFQMVEVSGPKQSVPA